MFAQGSSYITGSFLHQAPRFFVLPEPEVLRVLAVAFVFAYSQQTRVQTIMAEEAHNMSGTYKVVEIVGTSPTSFAEAVRSAVEEASKTLRHVDWFEVVEQRGRIVEGKVQEFQVSMKVGFKIER
jgi:dodecin